jgi:hypothetical protein
MDRTSALFVLFVLCLLLLLFDLLLLLLLQLLSLYAATSLLVMSHPWPKLHIRPVDIL